MLAWLWGARMVLPESMSARFPELGEARWRRGGLPPKVGGWCLGKSSVSGIALGRTVFLAPHARLDAALLLHELAHVHQFERYTVFPIRYFWESVRRGYRGNRFEHDADRFAAARLSHPSSGV